MPFVAYVTRGNRVNAYFVDTIIPVAASGGRTAPHGGVDDRRRRTPLRGIPGTSFFMAGLGGVNCWWV